MKQLRREVGRVVFNSNREWVVLTLDSHVNNVTRLVELWDAERAYLAPSDLSKTRVQTIKAAEIHDMGKPSHFRLKYQGFREGPPEWSYSFAGHRFAVEHDDRYIYHLGQLHHEYSVEGIVKAIADLRNRKMTDIADHLPLDLYTLEMADQIEATVARAAVGADDPEARVFMDFLFDTIDRQDAIYKIDPFPFREEPLNLNVEYAVLTPSEKLVVAVENAPAEAKRQPLREAQEWLESELQTSELITKGITLCPWN